MYVFKSAVASRGASSSSPSSEPPKSNPLKDFLLTLISVFNLIETLKSNATFTLDYTNETEMSEALFNTINWITGDNNGTAITTKTNPHSEITWTKVKAEMDKL